MTTYTPTPEEQQLLDAHGFTHRETIGGRSFWEMGEGTFPDICHHGGSSARFVVREVCIDNETSYFKFESLTAAIMFLVLNGHLKEGDAR